MIPLHFACLSFECRLMVSFGPCLWPNHMLIPGASISKRRAMGVIRDVTVSLLKHRLIKIVNISRLPHVFLIKTSHFGFILQTGVIYAHPTSHVLKEISSNVGC